MIKLGALGLLLVAAAFFSAPAFIISSFGVDLQVAYTINITTFWFGIAICILATTEYLSKRSISAAEK